MFQKIALVFAALFVGLLVVIATRPATYRVERAVVVKAPADVAFSFVNDLHRFNEFSPWADLDPAMKATYSGSESGVGAVYEWTGNKDVGSGRMTITGTVPGERVDIRLEFIEPFAATALTTFTVAAEGDGSKVTWAMDGTNNFMSKAASLVLDMEKAIGGDFEKGLGRLAKLAEADASAREAKARQEAEAAAAAEAPAEEAVDAPVTP